MNKDKEIEDLTTALKKSAFSSADKLSEFDVFPDTDTDKGIFTARNIHIDRFRLRLGEIKAMLDGYNMINACVMKATPGPDV